MRGTRGREKPLYDRVGFETVESFPIFVSGHSEHFPAH
jgi:hypothetical protein